MPLNQVSQVGPADQCAGVRRREGSRRAVWLFRFGRLTGRRPRRGAEVQQTRRAVGRQGKPVALPAGTIVMRCPAWAHKWNHLVPWPPWGSFPKAVPSALWCSHSLRCLWRPLLQMTSRGGRSAAHRRPSPLIPAKGLLCRLSALMPSMPMGVPPSGCFCRLISFVRGNYLPIVAPTTDEWRPNDPKNRAGRPPGGVIG